MCRFGRRGRKSQHGVREEKRRAVDIGTAKIEKPTDLIERIEHQGGAARRINRRRYALQLGANRLASDRSTSATVEMVDARE